MHLDETTLYSVLGLCPDASERDIRKAYMKLAKLLHPDKSKSDTAAELFKIVVHSHSILTCPKQKYEYDLYLQESGLNKYDPCKTSIAAEKAKKPAIPGVPEEVVITKQTTKRKNKPYEQQPYGFGFESTAHKDPKKNTHRDEKVFKNDVNHSSSIQVSENSDGNVSNEAISTDSGKKIRPSDNQDVYPNKKIHIQSDEKNYSYEESLHESTNAGFNSESTQNFNLSNTYPHEDDMTDVVDQFNNTNIASTPTSLDAFNIDRLTLHNEQPSAKVRKAESQNLQTEWTFADIMASNRGSTFDMNNLKQSIRTVPTLKRARLSKNDKPLALNEIEKEITAIDLNMIRNQVPEIIEFPLKDTISIDKHSIIEQTKQFNSSCNFLKEYIFSIMTKRLELDTRNNGSLSNQPEYKVKRSYDVQLTKILLELQERQEFVSNAVQDILSR